MMCFILGGACVHLEESGPVRHWALGGNTPWMERYSTLRGRVWMKCKDIWVYCWKQEQCYHWRWSVLQGFWDIYLSMHAFSGLEGSPGFGNRSQKVPSSLDWNTGSSINLIRICSDLYPHLAAAHCRSFFGQSQHVQVHVVLASSAQTEAEAFTVSLQVHGVQLPILNTHTHTQLNTHAQIHMYINTNALH